MREKGLKRRVLSLFLAVSLILTGITIPVEAGAAATYMVFFDSQGGSYCNYITGIPENTRITLPTPTKEGYVFAGWYTDSTYTDQFYSWETVTGSMLLYAKWNNKPIRTAKAEYTGEPVVINNYVDKKDIVVTVTYSDGTIAVLDEEEFYLENDYYDTAGDKYVSVYYNDTQSDYKRWLCSVKVKYVKETVYCIGFDTMGGSAVAPITGIAPNSTISLPANPTKKGYVFDGWYLEEDYETKFTGKEKIKKTFIVYAKWVKKTEADEETDFVTWEDDMKLNTTVANVKVGATESIFVNTTDPGYQFSYESSNETIARVNEKGIVTGVSDGKAVICVYTENGTVLKCKVGVGDSPYITEIEPNREVKRVPKGDTYQLKVKIKPAKLDSSLLSYQSSNKDIATVNAEGLVKAKKKGTCYITVKTEDGGNLQKRIKIIVI